jgi:hypothetical protein
MAMERILDERSFVPALKQGAQGKTPSGRLTAGGGSERHL